MSDRIDLSKPINLQKQFIQNFQREIILFSLWYNGWRIMNLLVQELCSLHQ
ncbi:hypothetical protein L1999_16675 [Neobacillus drentensis]|uniref:hypothetical protein n=1 Tax=Neobacillus drentensis TaxID=220684 RepID=UPI001F36D912|nr:hypothetical protein [Neobacillus drentensis]ULT54777.1 hypothetical protein L1999_16675 [Neobacillus drentensis]